MATGAREVELGKGEKVELLPFLLYYFFPLQLINSINQTVDDVYRLVWLCPEHFWCYFWYHIYQILFLWRSFHSQYATVFFCGDFELKCLRVTFHEFHFVPPLLNFITILPVLI